MNIQLTNKQIQITDIVKKFNGLDIRQLYYLMNSPENGDIDTDIDELFREKILALLDNRYIVPYGINSVSQESIDALWAALILGNYSVSPENIEISQKPCILAVSGGSKTRFEIVFYDGEEIDFDTEKHDKNMSDTNVITVFITKGRDMVEKLMKSNLDISFIITNITEYKDEKPQFVVEKTLIQKKDWASK